MKEMKDHLDIKYKEYGGFKEILQLEVSPYAVKDLGEQLRRLNWSTPVICIEEIFVDKMLRGKGYGSGLIKYVCENYYSHLILVEAGALKKEYKEEPSQQEIHDIVENLGDWYEKLGFINVNHLLGQYQTRIAYLYYNEVGIELMVELNRFHEESNLKNVLMGLESCKDKILSLYTEAVGRVSREGIKDYVLNRLNHILNMQILTSDEIPNVVNICHQLLGANTDGEGFDWVGSTLVGIDKTILSITLRLGR